MIAWREMLLCYQRFDGKFPRRCPGPVRAAVLLRHISTFALLPVRSLRRNASQPITPAIISHAHPYPRGHSRFRLPRTPQHDLCISDLKPDGRPASTGARFRAVYGIVDRGVGGHLAGPAVMGAVGRGGIEYEVDPGETWAAVSGETLYSPGWEGSGG